MIFYFTGTGNSFQIARSIAEHNNERLVSIAFVMKSEKGCFEYTLNNDEIIGFVYPVYAWAPPKMVLQFIEKLKLNGYNNNYVFSVAICGDNIGNTMEVLQKSLSKCGIHLDSGFSIKMPNNYIIMGDVDSKDVEQKKLSEAEQVIKDITGCIKEKRKNVFEINKGPLPWLMTSIINPMFNKHAMDTKKFYANDKCTKCGLCQKICNTRNIKVKDHPIWGNECTQCLACIHYCPVQAIQYGKATERKGRYTNPNVNVNEILLNDFECKND